MLLQSRMSEVLHVDIHPAARIGRGILMDHATGVVVGETAVVGDNVSLLHQVTLGGSGTGKGVRHPHVGEYAGQYAKQVCCNAPDCCCCVQNLRLLWREWLWWKGPRERVLGIWGCSSTCGGSTAPGSARMG